MATTTAISGQPTVNNGGTILKAGNFTEGNITASQTLANNAADRYAYGSRPFLPVEVASSGNIGVIRPLSTGEFATMEAGEYVAKVIGDRVAQTDNTTLRSPGSDFGLRVPTARFYGYQRLNITSWDYVTGAATTGAAAGDTVLASGIDGQTGFAADDAVNPTFAQPGHLVFKTGAFLPSGVYYAAKTSV